VRYLLDTCVLSELVKTNRDNNVVDWFEKRKPHELCISAMTWGELNRGVDRMTASKRRSELTQWLDQLVIGFEDRVLAFDQTVARAWSQMTVQAEANGKPMAAFDSIIAATARAYDCKLVTRNVRDFAQAGVEIVNPWLS
jgi:predicted nucleic acid-binding protein